MEMDPWVISDVLRPNLESTGFLEASTIHTARVETFLKDAERFVGNSILSLSSQLIQLLNFFWIMHRMDLDFVATLYFV